MKLINIQGPKQNSSPLPLIACARRDHVKARVPEEEGGEQEVNSRDLELDGRKLEDRGWEVEPSRQFYRRFVILDFLRALPGCCRVHSEVAALNQADSLKKKDLLG